MTWVFVDANEESVSYEDSVVRAYMQGRRWAARNGGPDGSTYQTQTEQHLAWMSGYRDKLGWMWRQPTVGEH